MTARTIRPIEALDPSREAGTAHALDEPEGDMAEDPRKPIRDPKGASDAPVKEPPPQKPPVEEPEKVEDDLNEDDRFQSTDN
jgi:hypothetical protein